MLRFDHLCYGQWFAMVNLSPRLPIKKQTTDEPETSFQKADIFDSEEKNNLKGSEKPDFEEDLLL